MEVERILWGAFIASLMVTASIAIWGIASRPNLVKKLIALTTLGDSACLFIAAAGFRVPYGELPQPPIAGYPRPVDPLPQAMVITAVVIELGLVLVLASIAVRLYEHEGSLSLPEILVREEVEAEEAIEE
ncbi:MAG: Na+/H+ antiporter subunit C [Thermoprotei archaeon]|nr:MAG: Na+/H+ antiporter subunit C [Thermoprotei archaeon]